MRWSRRYKVHFFNSVCLALFAILFNFCCFRYLQSFFIIIFISSSLPVKRFFYIIKKIQNYIQQISKCADKSSVSCPCVDSYQTVETHIHTHSKRAKICIQRHCRHSWNDTENKIEDCNVSREKMQWNAEIHLGFGFFSFLWPSIRRGEKRKNIYTETNLCVYCCCL